MSEEIRTLFGLSLPGQEPKRSLTKEEAEVCAQKLATLMGWGWKGVECVPTGSEVVGQPVYFMAERGPVRIYPFTPSLMDPFRHFNIVVKDWSTLESEKPHHTPLDEDPRKLMGWLTEMRKWTEKAARMFRKAENSCKEEQ